MQADPDKINAVIMGIGINANQKQEHFDEEIQHIATSLAIESGKPIVRAELMQQIYLQLEKLYEEYLQNGFSVIKILWESYAVSIGKEITARTMRETITGLAKGITEDGVLLLEDHEGKYIIFILQILKLSKRSSSFGTSFYFNSFELNL